MSPASRLARVLLVLSVTVPGALACSHTVNIKSNPPGAVVFIDGEKRGETPLAIEEDDGFFEERVIRVEKEGYQSIETTIVQTEPIWGCVAPSVCLAPFTFCTSCFGLRWSTKYAEEYEVVLDPVGKGPDSRATKPDDEPQDPAMTIPY